ncbi:MAG: nucleoside kinase, partial [Rikenellaceae bacterium]|nr:nucleoside kinase [Rikenellaceae bacterium]
MGKNLREVLNMLSFNNRQPFLAAYVNNTLRELGYRVFSPVSIRFIDITHFEGMRVYQRTLFFVLNKAVVDLFPGHALKIKHSVAKGFYCEVEGMENLPAESIERIKARMQELIVQNIPIVGQRILREEAEELYRQFGFADKISLMETRPHLYVKVEILADLPGFFYGALAPSTGFIHLFDVRKYFDGFYLAVPQRTDPTRLEKMIPQTKMFDVFHEYKDWVDILGVSTVGALNEKIIIGKAGELIKIAESFHEKKLGNIADTIHEKHNKDGV